MKSLQNMTDKERVNWYAKKDREVEKTYHGIHRVKNDPEETRLTHAEMQKRKHMFYGAK